MATLESFDPRATDTVAKDDTRQTQIHVRLQIPKQYKQEPILSDLISRYGLTVNIQAALLSASAHEDGWFDLELHGTEKRIQEGLIYLNDLDLKIWKDTDEENW
ncbi:MAG: NIL domain-containing protein [Oculatellaceae cyanobacterium Prado106]|jgi:ABC-type methionine transport system ATPase subunit|nr:NIL domain-containing protein [Oculatellaceae cyanobacterium Prado106]